MKRFQAVLASTVLTAAMSASADVVDLGTVSSERPGTYHYASALTYPVFQDVYSLELPVGTDFLLGTLLNWVSAVPLRVSLSTSDGVLLDADGLYPNGRFSFRDLSAGVTYYLEVDGLAPPAGLGSYDFVLLAVAGPALAAVPEPDAWLLALSGLAGVALACRLRPHRRALFV